MAESSDIPDMSAMAQEAGGWAALMHHLQHVVQGDEPEALAALTKMLPADTDPQQVAEMIFAVAFAQATELATVRSAIVGDTFFDFSHIHGPDGSSEPSVTMVVDAVASYGVAVQTVILNIPVIEISNLVMRLVETAFYSIGQFEACTEKED